MKRPKPGYHSTPLLLLWWLKKRGQLRLLVRRSKTLGGAVSLAVGVLLLGAWIASIVLRSSIVERTIDPPSTELVQLGLLAYLGFIAFSSLSFRGVYMPKPELERLFSAPVKRASIVRFRMLAAMLMALPFTAIVALFLSPRFASPAAAALGLAFTIPATSVFGQSLSLLAARTGGLGERLLGRVSPTLLRAVGALGILAIFTFLAFGPGIDSSSEARNRRVAEEYVRGRFGPHPITEPRNVGGLGAEENVPLESPSALGQVESVAKGPVVRALTSPLRPWAKAISSPSLGAALPWVGLIASLMVLLFEAVARLPVDFRETSLRTSKDLERRLARMRSGQGGAGAFGVSSATSGWRVPWIAGRSPFGAVVWVRVAWLVRQARGTLIIALVVAVIGTLVGIRVFDEPGSGPLTIAILGVVYLSSGIRADFRADLDRMESLRAWPLAPWKVFLGTILPGTLLTSSVIALVLLVRAVALGQVSGSLWWTMAAVPVLAYVWTAVDNAVFLLFPVRFIPGQGSALQHTGRGFLLVMLRGLILVGALAFAGGGGWLLYEVSVHEDLSNHRFAVGLALGWVVFTAVLLLVSLTAFGAWALRRFDVAKVPSSSQ